MLQRMLPYLERVQKGYKNNLEDFSICITIRTDKIRKAQSTRVIQDKFKGVTCL